MIWRLLIVACAIFLFAEARWHQKREANVNICDTSYNSTNKIRCFCTRDHRDEAVIRSADCSLTVKEIPNDDHSWDTFSILHQATKLTLSNIMSNPFRYIPDKALKHATHLLKIDLKYGNVEKIHAFAFANLSFVEEITLGGNEIKTLEANAFAHHKDLKTIGLDKNNIVEINRNVFVDLPSLERIFLTGNKITTIHDRAFVHLAHLKELEIDGNMLFSLNIESFSGLKNLEKLDVSRNSLEVIGDNTFLPLVNLKYLNLEQNKIQMLDEKAFHGLTKLQYLSIAHNKLVNIENEKVFINLNALSQLNLKKNKITELKQEVIQPIMNNLYSNEGYLDIEENNFPCDCRLEWFVTLMNETQNQRLHGALENLKCMPDSDLRDRWTKTVEAEKKEQAFEEDQANADYEYYDHTELNGLLFYIDLRDLLNCSKTNANAVETSTTIQTTTKQDIVVSTTKLPTTSSTPESAKYTQNKVTNFGVLDLSVTTTEIPVVVKSKMDSNENKIRVDKKIDHTTSRLATVSAKPIEDKYEQHNMASDQGVPDKIKAQRSVQHEDGITKNVNSAHRDIGCVSLIVILFARLF